MKRMISAAALFITPFTVLADSQRQCNSALDKTAAYIKSQSTISNTLNNLQKPSRNAIDTQIQTSQNIVNESKRIIALCDLDQEMTEGVVDLIIENKENMKKLAYDANRYE